MSPITIGTTEMKIPKINEANMSPTSIAHIAIGVVSNRSNVLNRASNGTIAGPIDIEEK